MCMTTYISGRMHATPIALAVLSDGTRRHLVALLGLQRELCVCEMETALQQEQPAMSRHLAVLRAAGWVRSRRESRRVYYRLARLPAWARLLARALSTGGVPPRTLHASRARLARFARRAQRRTPSTS